MAPTPHDVNSASPLPSPLANGPDPSASWVPVVEPEALAASVERLLKRKLHGLESLAVQLEGVAPGTPAAAAPHTHSHAHAHAH